MNAMTPAVKPNVSHLRVTSLTPRAGEQRMRRLMAGDPELIEEAAANLAEAFASAGSEVRTAIA